MKRFFQRGLCDAAIRSAVGALLLFGCTAVSQADIYQWTYAANGYTIIQSTTLCPGGAGVSAVPGVDLSSRDLTKAALWNTNLSAANLSNVILANAYATNCNLTNAELAGRTLDGTDFFGSSLQGADFTGATVTGTNFLACGLISAQLYSTASYKNHDLVGIDLSDEEMTGWNFVNQDLSYAVFSEGHRGMDYADLTGQISATPNWPHTCLNANFTDAILRNAQLDLSSLGTPTSPMPTLPTPRSNRRISDTPISPPANYTAPPLQSTVSEQDRVELHQPGRLELRRPKPGLRRLYLLHAHRRPTLPRPTSEAPPALPKRCDHPPHNPRQRDDQQPVAPRRRETGGRNSDIPITRRRTSLDPAATLQFLFDGNPYPYNGT